MIASFKHKGLKRLFEDDDRSRSPPTWSRKSGLFLSALEAAGAIGHLNQPSFRLHPLKGDLKGHWAVTVRANWRIVFGFEGDKATDVDLIDYH